MARCWKVQAGAMISQWALARAVIWAATAAAMVGAGNGPTK
jgi:hypothetical protein